MKPISLLGRTQVSIEAIKAKKKEKVNGKKGHQYEEVMCSSVFCVQYAKEVGVTWPTMDHYK